MRVLVACEESGTVRDAFLALGHDAYSCDLKPARSNPMRHFQCDAWHPAHSMRWDLMIAHPPCTEFSLSGARWRTDHWVTKKTHPKGGYWYDGTRKRELQKIALKFVQSLWDAPIDRVAIENPVGDLSTLWQKPDQIIHPWQYGHPEFKRTCLWLRNLPLLVPTCILEPPDPSDRKEHEAWSVVHRMVKGEGRDVARAVTYTGWAKAMAAQWGASAVSDARSIGHPGSKSVRQ